MPASHKTRSSPTRPHLRHICPASSRRCCGPAPPSRSSGPLGAGKTAFVRAVVEALHGESVAHSPTFTSGTGTRVNRPSIISTSIASTTPPNCRNWAWMRPSAPPRSPCRVARAIARASLPPAPSVAHRGQRRRSARGDALSDPKGRSWGSTVRWAASRRPWSAPTAQSSHRAPRPLLGIGGRARRGGRRTRRTGR